MANDARGPNDPCWCGSSKKYKHCHRDFAGSVAPGVQSPRRTVPAGIAAPDYAQSGTPVRRPESRVKSPEIIEKLRVAGRAAAEILAETSTHIAPGVTTDELDAVCHQACIDRGGYPSPLNYHGYPKSLCTSVNEVICHGIPDDRALVEGDVVNLDVTIFLNGVHGDTNGTFAVGEVDAPSRKLIHETREACDAGIRAVRPGRPISDIGAAIQQHAERHGYGVIRAFVGHGIGEQFHTDLHIPHYFEPTANTIMQPGMVFTIEPMIAMGDWRHVMWDDEWTAVTRDLSRVAQFEHMVLVTDAGVDVLTRTPAKVAS
ncbi:MAG: type I methionyl aminopeptidase [Acidimicrobiia bacterium]